MFEFETGYGYKVGGIVQYYDPDFPGFVIMTEARALECAEIVLKRLID